MDLLQALAEIPNLIADYKATADRLIEAEKELEANRLNKYVSLEWVAEYWSVDRKTARLMILTLSTGRRSTKQLKVLSYGAKIIRYRRKDIEEMTDINLVAIKDMLRIKRENKERLVHAGKKSDNE